MILVQGGASVQTLNTIQVIIQDITANMEAVDVYPKSRFLSDLKTRRIYMESVEIGQDVNQVLLQVQVVPEMPGFEEMYIVEYPHDHDNVPWVIGSIDEMQGIHIRVYRITMSKSWEQSGRWVPQLYQQFRKMLKGVVR